MTAAPPIRLGERSKAAHKGDFGRAILVGGSRGMAGSIALASMAVLHTGGGASTAAVPDACLETVAAFHPAIMTIPLPADSQGRFRDDAASALETNRLEMFDAIAAGPGMTTAPGSVRIVERLLGLRQRPRVLDADALNIIARHQLLDPSQQPGSLVLTPHPGELQRLTGVAPSDRAAQIEAAAGMAKALGVVVVVKGGPTVVVNGQQAWTCPNGNPGMATAGSGDVLTGVVTALAAQGYAAWDAARLGVWIHGRAGDLAAKQQGQPGMTALEILRCLPAAVAAAI